MAVEAAELADVVATDLNERPRLVMYSSRRDRELRSDAENLGSSAVIDKHASLASLAASLASIL